MQVTYVPQGNSTCGGSPDHPDCKGHSNRKTFLKTRTAVQFAVLVRFFSSPAEKVSIILVQVNCPRREI